MLAELEAKSIAYLPLTQFQELHAECVEKKANPPLTFRKRYMMLYMERTIHVLKLSLKQMKMSTSSVQGIFTVR